MKKIVLFGILMSLLQITVKAEPGEGSGLPLSFALFNNSVGLPGAGNSLLSGSPLHPGIRLGIEHYWVQKPKHLWFQTLNFSAYWIQELHYGFLISSDFGYRHVTPYGLFYEGTIGAGYLHTFNDGPIFQLDKEGEYSRKKDWGRPHFAPQAGVGISYDFKFRTGHTLSLFLQYQLQIEYPFTIPGNIPVLPHTCMFLGTRFKLPQKK